MTPETVSSIVSAEQLQQLRAVGFVVIPISHDVSIHRELDGTCTLTCRGMTDTDARLALASMGEYESVSPTWLPLREFGL